MRVVLLVGLLLLPAGLASAQDVQDARRLRRDARTTYLASGIVLTHAAAGIGLFAYELQRSEEASGLDAVGHAGVAVLSIVLSGQAALVGLVMLVVAFVLDVEAGLAAGSARAPPCLGICGTF